MVLATVTKLKLRLRLREELHGSSCTKEDEADPISKIGNKAPKVVFCFLFSFIVQ
jgi:hypothetical protein